MNKSNLNIAAEAATVSGKLPRIPEDSRLPKNHSAFFTIFKTQTKLSVRGGDMLIFGIAMPVGIMLLLGFISSPETIRNGFSGVACIGMCASAFMGIPLTLAGFRYERILKRFKVTPASPGILLGANALLQTCFSVVCCILIFLVAHFCFGLTLASPLRFVATFVFGLFVLFSMGFLIGAIVPNIKTVNWVTTLIYFPSLFLSGATVPYDILPKGLQYVSNIFPMTQVIKLVDNAVLGAPLQQDFIRFGILIVVSLICYIIALKSFKWE